MPNAFICNFCPIDSIKYPNMTSLQSHIKEVHLPQMRQTYGVTPAKAKEADKLRAEHGQKAVAPSTAPQNPSTMPVAAPIPKRKPIVLQYQYQGECETCGVPVETLEMNISGGLFMVAWCTNCKKKIKDIKVVPIETMDKRIMENTVEEIAIEENASTLKGVWPINKMRKKK